LGNDRLRIVESVEKEWAGLAAHERATVRAAFEKIDDDPIIGAPLFEPLKGIWSARLDNLRILYRIVAEARFVVILSITRVAEPS
jgi:mRNA-degrading endonuclease RelE of RelBE toxin-antitoxin system